MLAAALACTADGAAPLDPPPQPDERPLGLGEVSEPAELVLADLDLYGLDPAELSVRRPVDLLLSTARDAGEREPFQGRDVDEAQTGLFAFDWATGTTRTLIVRTPSEASLAALRVLRDGERLYALHPVRRGGSLGTLVEEVSLAGGALARREIDEVPEDCVAVMGGDLFFRSGDAMRAIRNVGNGGAALEPELLGPTEACGRRLAAIAGELVALDHPTEIEPAERIAVWALSPETGARTHSLLDVGAADLYGPEGYRPTRFALAPDGLYAVVRDAGGLEIWFVAWARRPGSQGGGAAPGEPPRRLTRLAVPFFAQVVPFEGSTLAIDEVSHLGADGGVLAMTVRIEEQAGERRFLWNALLVADVYRGKVDLAELGTALTGLDVVARD